MNKTKLERAAKITVVVKEFATFNLVNADVFTDLAGSYFSIRVRVVKSKPVKGSNLPSCFQNLMLFVTLPKCVSSAFIQALSEKLLKTKDKSTRRDIQKGLRTLSKEEH
ncbi:hypothetical protein SADUNF_Sadunf16G0046900 [Salix dunnii]|uniref:Uncharacterized protein n=1 Tax=Salix dunnii TaxID=1413687 RepID=A0A835MI98_9ROSI|nr:hypothetical protein SADUNF_Sadunf16G0046900 [Salix dunnii]